MTATAGLTDNPTGDPLRILHAAFGHRSFRKGQQAVIDHLLGAARRDRPAGGALVLMPTGMGKSLCYQVPALCLEGMTLVLSPLIALMKDQVDALKRQGLNATFINSSLGRRERDLRYAQVARGEVKLLYVTPERFRKAAFLEALDQAMRRSPLALLAVDEAHCISEWGHDFRPDYSRVGELRRRMGYPPTVALTATATPRVQLEILEQLELHDHCAARSFRHGIDRPNLHLEVEKVWGEDDKLAHLLQVAESLKGHGGGAIAYCTLIKTLDTLADRLESKGVQPLRYHGKLEPSQRRAVQEHFMQCGGLVLATNAFGMGIDKADIRTLVHVELPGSVEAYYQEIGRAGRDGDPAQCTLLYDENDLLTHMRFIEWSNPGVDLYRRIYEHLRNDGESIRAFGLDWLREKLHAKQGRHDRRLDTALAMLERHGVIEAEPQDWVEGRYELVGELPESLTCPDRLAARLKADQMRLHDMVRYANTQDSRKAFLAEYFGVSN